jgi:hypothetical protein
VLARLPTGARQEEELTGKLPSQTGIEAFGGRKEIPDKTQEAARSMESATSLSAEEGSTAPWCSKYRKARKKKTTQKAS